MPIEHRSPRGCFDIFRQHMAPVVSAILGPASAPVLKLDKDDETRRVFEFQDPAGIRIPTSNGYVHLELSNKLRTIQRSSRIWRLRTDSYRYALRGSASTIDEPLFRWEYEREPAIGGEHDPARPYRSKGLYCRHHLQFGSFAVDGGDSMTLGSQVLHMGKVHLPTGWVLIEEVLRFIIVELGATPYCGDEWNEQLRSSEDRFFNDFTGKRS